jgi:hypothetical protein
MFVWVCLCVSVSVYLCLYIVCMHVVAFKAVHSDPPSLHLALSIPHQLHPYFVGDDVMHLRADGSIPSLDRKLAALNDYVRF